MNTEYEQLQVEKNESKKRFELEVDGFLSFINYQEEDKKIKLIHTEVAEELAGRGVGSALVEKTLSYIEAQGYSLYPYCPFVFAYIKRHPDWKRIVDSSFLKYDEL